MIEETCKDACGEIAISKAIAYLTIEMRVLDAK